MKTIKRRNFLKIFTFVSVFGGMAGQTAYALVKSFFPKVRYEPPQRFKVGAAHQFTDGPNFLPKHGIFVIWVSIPHFFPRNSRLIFGVNL